MTGTAAKMAIEIAPFLIPGVNTYYGMYKMGQGLAFVLPTFYKSIEGIFLGDSSNGDETKLWKAMNSAQGYLSKFNQRSVSDEGNQGLLNFEQLGNLVTDIYSQIYEQRAAATLSQFFYKKKEADYLKKLAESSKEQLESFGKSEFGQNRIFGQLGKIGETATEEQAQKLGQKAAAKISELNTAIKKRSQLAKNLSLSYMAMTQSAQVYGEALEGGYDRRTAGAAALLSASGQFWLMSKASLGEWFLDESVGYTREGAQMAKSVNSLISKEFAPLKEGIEAMGFDKQAGKLAIGSTFKKIKDNTIRYISSANTSDGLVANISRNSVIEGLEEVSEQAVIDTVKGITDFLSSVGFTGNQGTFGG